jgi:hypothetical protein
MSSSSSSKAIRVPSLPENKLNFGSEITTIIRRRSVIIKIFVRGEKGEKSEIVKEWPEPPFVVKNDIVEFVGQKDQTFEQMMNYAYAEFLRIVDDIQEIKDVQRSVLRHTIMYPINIHIDENGNIVEVYKAMLFTFGRNNMPIALTVEELSRIPKYDPNSGILLPRDQQKSNGVSFLNMGFRVHKNTHYPFPLRYKDNKDEYDRDPGKLLASQFSDQLRQKRELINKEEEKKTNS